jgi:hypothetical protein
MGLSFFYGALMELKSTSVSKCLDKKMMIMGFEIPDLLMIFLTISILNFMFGSTGMKLILVWLPSIALALTIRISKRGKPDNYLLHWLRFQMKPGIISAFAEPSHSESILRPRRKGK